MQRYGAYWALLLFPLIAASAQPDPANARYPGIYDAPIQLSDGVYQGPPFVEGGASRPRVQLIDRLQQQADLNGDGLPDQLALLSASSGGSGENLYLAVVAGDGSVSTQLLGDRVKVRDLRIQDGTPMVDLIVAGPEDPACCPTFKQRRTYRFAQGKLQRTHTQELGPMGLADIEGVQWRLVELGRAQTLPADIQISALFKEGKVSGQSACNRYFAPVTDQGGMQLEIGPVASSRMACPDPVMQRESKFLQALQKTERFSFLSGRLVLTYRDGETIEHLLFAQNKSDG
jgi:heat shock protein HslJ